MKRAISILLTMCILLSAFSILSLNAGAAQVSEEDIAATGTSGDVLYVFGDSISEGYLEHGKYVDSWVKHVIDTNGYKAHPDGYYKRKQMEEAGTVDPNVSQMIGESGLGFVNKSAWSHYYTYFLNNTDFSPADKVVVALGINDWYINTSIDTFFDHMKTTFTKIRSDNPDCELFYLLPFNVEFIGNYNTHYALYMRGDSDTTKTYGYTLLNYGKLIKDKFKDDPTFAAFNVTIIDMMDCAAINRDTIQAGALYQEHDDRLHPVAATHVELAKELSKRLEAHGHLLTKHEATDPTCADGNSAYWSCEDADCGKYFSDANAENEIAENSWVIPAVDEHQLSGTSEWTWTGDATYGYTAASYADTCTVCGSHVGLPATITKSHANGKTVYTATTTAPSGQVFTDTKIRDGQALYVLGDYIPYGYGVSGGVNNSWVGKVINTNGYLPMTANGSKFIRANKMADAVTAANSNDFSNADKVVIACGLFDWTGDTVKTTFYSNLSSVLSKIRSDNPDCEVYYLLPFNTQTMGNYDTHFSLNRSGNSNQNKLYSFTLRQFGDDLKAKLASSDFSAYNVGAIDMMTCDAINRDTIQAGALYEKFAPTAATHVELAKELSKRLEARGHLLTEHPEAGATCTTLGSTAYWSCEDDCGRFFSDEHAEHEIAANSWEIPALGVHASFEDPDWTWTGSSADGYTAATVTVTCSVCGTQESLNAVITKTHTYGKNTFTATATASNGEVFTDSKEINGVSLYVLGDSIAQGFTWFLDQNQGGYVDSWVKRVVSVNGYLPLSESTYASKNISEAGIGFCCENVNNDKSAQDYANETDFSYADIVVVNLGINDWRDSTYERATLANFYSGMYSVFAKIREDNPTCKVYFILPFSEGQHGSYNTYYSLGAPVQSEGYDAYCCGQTLQHFIDLIKAKFNENAYQALDVTIVDMLECSAINRDTIRAGQLPDNLHPNAETQVKLGDEIAQRLNADGHLLTAHPATEATCVPGNSAYWSCEDDDCGKFFSDAHAENEIQEDSWVIPAVNAHSYHNPAWTWTGNDADGYTAASVTVICSVCGTEETVPAAVTKSYTTDATVYTATATVSGGQEFTDTKTVDGQVFLTGYTLSVQGDIGVNFYYNISAEQAANATVSFSWTVEGNEKTESIDMSKIAKSSNGYKATCSVAPAEMSYDIVATLTINGEEKDTRTYSVKQYAESILTDTDFRTDYIAKEGQAKYDALIELIHAMLDYGSRAQIRFDRNAENPVNSGAYTYTDPVDPSAIPDTMSDMSKDLTNYGLAYTGSTVVLLANTSIRHYYQITDQTKFDLVKDSITFNGEAVTYTVKGDEIYFELADIAAPNLDTVYRLHIGSTDYSYSVLDYVRRSLSRTDESANEKTQALVTAMYYYNQKANVFFGEPNVAPEHYEWNQTSELVRSYLENANYDPTDYSRSVIADYAPVGRSLENERPIGYAFNIKQAGTLTIAGYSQQVEAGSYTVYNIVPNSSTVFTVTDANGRVVQWGTLNPTHFLRQIKSPNSRNMRDLGGWACDGGTIKYGKIIRGGVPTADDRDVLVDQLGITTEFELRSTIDADLKDNPPTSSVLGDDIAFHIYDNFAWYGFTRTELCKQILGDIFEAVENDEPVYIHCHAGADRTGTIAFILEAILGMSQSDMDMDYELTSFYVGGENARCRNSADTWLSMINQINAKSGATFRDKAVQCVLDLGFTIDEINAFRAKMIDGTPEILTAV